MMLLAPAVCQGGVPIICSVIQGRRCAVGFAVLLIQKSIGLASCPKLTLSVPS